MFCLWNVSSRPVRSFRPKPGHAEEEDEAAGARPVNYCLEDIILAKACCWRFRFFGYDSSWLKLDLGRSFLDINMGRTTLGVVVMDVSPSLSAGLFCCLKPMAKVKTSSQRQLLLC